MQLKNICCLSILSILLLENSGYAQLGRGGLLRRILGRDTETEEKADDKSADAKSEKSEKAKQAELQEAVRGRQEANRALRVPTPVPFSPDFNADPNALRLPTSPTDRRGLGSIMDAGQQRYGLSLESANTADVQAFGLTLASPIPERSQRSGKGLVVRDVEPDSDGHQAGISPGDILLEVGGMNVAAPQALQGFQEALSPGDQIEVVLLRRGKKLVRTLVVTTEKVDNESSKGQLAEDIGEPAHRPKPIQVNPAGSLPFGSALRMDNSQLSHAQLLELVREQERIITELRNELATMNRRTF